MFPLNIVLHEPEIPQNTGNIARTCAATGTRLHLIKPLGFEITDARLKRAGLDYWDKLSVQFYDSIAQFYAKNQGAVCRFFTTKAQKCYTDVPYPENCFLFFGKETRGLPESLLAQNPGCCVRIPMFGDIRSLNLSNAAAVGLYEALRQRGFANLSFAGGFPAKSYERTF